MQLEKKVAASKTSQVATHISNIFCHHYHHNLIVIILGHQLDHHHDHHLLVLHNANQVIEKVTIAITMNIMFILL